MYNLENIKCMRKDITAMQITIVDAEVHVRLAAYIYCKSTLSHTAYHPCMQYGLNNLSFANLSQHQWAVFLLIHKAALQYYWS
jgi:hypothetical protein